MKPPNPRVSIVIPCYNEERFIGRTLESLKKQNYSHGYEVIVVDNNCTDKTVAVAKSYGVRIIRENTPGVCWARQAGTEAANGKIIVSTDADTTFSSNWLQNIEQAFQQNKKCVAVAGPCSFSDGPWWGKIYPKLLFGTVSIFTRIINRPFYITATNIAFKKSAWEQYNTALTQGGDELELLHALEKKGKVVFNNKNPVHTSGRRLEKGLFYNFFMSFLAYYLLAYYLNKLFNRPVLGTAPAYRLPISPSNRRLAFAYRTAVVAFVVSIIHLPGHDTILQQANETFATVRNRIEKVI